MPPATDQLEGALGEIGRYMVSAPTMHHLVLGLGIRDAQVNDVLQLGSRARVDPVPGRPPR